MKTNWLKHKKKVQKRKLLVDTLTVVMGIMKQFFKRHTGNILLSNMLMNHHNENKFSFWVFHQKIFFGKERDSEKNCVCHRNFLCLSVSPTESGLSRSSQWLNSFHHTSVKKSPRRKKKHMCYSWRKMFCHSRFWVSI